MVVHIRTVAFQGIEATSVDVQVQVAPGMPAFSIVGLGDKAVTESRERVRSALHACGLAMPAKRIVVNLAPADLPKEGSHYDLPIALGLMAAVGAIDAGPLDEFVALGELALDGCILATSGVLPAAVFANSDHLGLICPASCGSEAAWAGPEQIILAPASLNQLVNHFRQTQLLSAPRPGAPRLLESGIDLADIRGQESARRALEVAAAGGHNLLMSGPPGAGKSMLASRLPGLLPPLTAAEILEASMIASIAGDLTGGQISGSRPYRAPHHSATMAAMIGGGTRIRPGEVSLAHRGVLFLDELPEFSPHVLDGLRQPLESGEVHVARANMRVRYPANFLLIAAMNPCRCGGVRDGEACRRGQNCAADYQKRISGPLLDRIDIRIDVPAVSAVDLIHAQPSESSKAVAGRVNSARAAQSARYEALAHQDGPVVTNADCGSADMEKLIDLDSPAKQLLHQAATQLKLSARGYFRTLKVARTLADLDGRDAVSKIHLAEAISYRVTPPNSAVAA